MGNPTFGNQGFDFMFSVFPIIFIVIFLFVIGFIVFVIVSGAKQNYKNNQSPLLIVEATVVSKRTDVTHHHNGTTDNMSSMSSSTWYYVTFQVESGDRMELPVSGTDFGMLAEGDVGRLTFQGTRYIGFERRY